MAHNVRSYKWVEGILAVSDTFLASIEEAFEFIKSVEGHLVKIFDHNNILVHEENREENKETYA
jgi:hypothetical protein